MNKFFFTNLPATLGGSNLNAFQMKKTLLAVLLTLITSVSISQQYMWGAEAGVGTAAGQFSSTFVNATTYSSGDNPTSWTALTISDGNGSPGAAYWTQSLLGYSQGINSDMTPLASPTMANGIAIFDSDYLDNDGMPANIGNGVAPATQRAELISPRFDLTGYTDSVTAAKLFLKYDAISFTELSVSLSTDDGTSWTPAVDLIGIHPNGVGGFTSAFFASEPLNGVANLSQCRLKFTFEGAYNYVLIDDLSLIQGGRTGATASSPPFIYSYSTVVENSCGPFTSPSGNYVWSTSGVYYDTIPNSQSKDSLMTIHLNVLSSSSATDTHVTCDSLTWIDGNTYTANNNTAIHTLTNSAGCDSIITLDLTITNSNSGTDTQTACNSFDWIDGNTYTSSNTTATHTLTNAAGCDSIVTLNLTLNILAGDVNNNCSIDGSEIAGDLDGNGAIDNGEMAGDLDGDGSIGAGEELGDTDGDGVVTAPELCGDSNGNGVIDAGEVANDCDGDGIADNVGISEQTFDLKIYPNPAGENITVEIPASFIGSKLVVRDALGKIQHSEVIQQVKANIQINDLAAGVYSVSVNQQTLMIIKE